ncbi:MAG: hypothetical protein V7L20_09095 [Nostoc sp.]
MISAYEQATFIIHNKDAIDAFVGVEFSAFYVTQLDYPSFKPVIIELARQSNL